MNSMKKSYLTALDPKFAIKVISLDGRPVPGHIIKNIDKSIQDKYNKYFDREEGIVYIGKGI